MKREFDHLVYVRLTEDCNLRCRHCFVPPTPVDMTIDQVKQIPEQIAGFTKPGQVVVVQWHGGEPTLRGITFIEECIEHFERCSHGVQWVHDMQTNLLTYSSEWADLYKRHFGGVVCASWDIGLRRFPNMEGSAAEVAYQTAFWAKVAQAQQDGLQVALTITVAKPFFERFKKPVYFFRMMEQKGIVKVHFERVTRAGAAKGEWGELGLTNSEFSLRMYLFARTYMYLQTTDEGMELQVSPFDGLFRAVNQLLRGDEVFGYGCWSGKCHSDFHTFSPEGYMQGCTALSMVDQKNLRPVEQAQDCNQCQFKPICSSGCRLLDWDDSGECPGGFELLRGIGRSLSFQQGSKEVIGWV